TVQFAPDANVVVQWPTGVVSTAKSALLAPVIAGAFSVIVDAPVLVSVTVSAEDGTVTGCVPKSSTSLFTVSRGLVVRLAAMRSGLLLESANNRLFAGP